MALEDAEEADDAAELSKVDSEGEANRDSIEGVAEEGPGAEDGPEADGILDVEAERGMDAAIELVEGLFGMFEAEEERRGALLRDFSSDRPFFCAAAAAAAAFCTPTLDGSARHIVVNQMC